MFRHVWYELTGTFISCFLELLKILPSFSPGVKLQCGLTATVVRPCGLVQESQTHKGGMGSS